MPKAALRLVQRSSYTQSISSNCADGLWNTPGHLKAHIYDFYAIDFDPCPVNPTFDGLDIDWGERNFCNPPFYETERWIKKIIQEQEKGRMTVLLIPARTCTHYFHELVLPNVSEIVFVKGRVRYVNQDGSRNGASPWPTILCIFRPKSSP